MNRIQLPQDCKTFVVQTLLVQLVCVYHLTVSSSDSEPYRTKCSRTSNFDVTYKDHVLSNHVIASHSVTSRFECAVHCVSDTRCKSYNYQYAGTDCQLNDATKTGLAISLTSQTGYTYFEHNTNTKVGCRPNPCGQGSCSETCSGHIVCDCRHTLFKGLRCEEVDEAKFLNTSTILQNELWFRKKIASWIEIASVWKKCYKASTDGWASTTFHVQCDRKGPTIAIIQVGQSIFGGYARTHWAGSFGYRSDAKAFLFSLRNNAGLAPFKLNVSTETGSNAIYSGSTYLVTYGGGHDLKIVENPHSNTNSYSNLGSSYKVPPGYQPHASDTRALLAGSYYFTVNEIEVFYTSEDTLKENSEILKDHPSYINQLMQWLDDNTKIKTQWRLCWRATRDGWKAKTFHDGCDTKGPTVTVVQVGHNYTFGGYTDKNWYRSSSSWITSASSFLFSLANSENLAPFKSTPKTGEDTYAILTGVDGPVFGRGHDLSLADNANSNLNSRAAMDTSYQVPGTVSNAKTILAGSEFFSPTAVEIFYQASDDLLYHSSIMSQEPQSLLVTLLDFLGGQTGWTVCWRGSRDGWAIGTFHNGCDSKGTTVTIVKYGSYIFGGYSVIDWNGVSGTGYQTNSNTFTFSLRNHQGTSPFKAFPQLSSYHVYVSSSYGPTFGGGHDIRISGQNVYTNFGHTYAAPVTMNNRQTFLAGTYPVTPTEIEVFYSSTY